MVSISQFAKEYKRDKKVCFNCDKGLKFYNYKSNMCRPCWLLFYNGKGEGSKKNYFKKGNKNINWKGDEVKYVGLHKWIRKYKPKPKFCEICKIKPPKDIANISGEYKRDIEDYQWICRRCHVIKDGTINNLKFFNELKGGNKLKWESTIKVN